METQMQIPDWLDKFKTSNNKPHSGAGSYLVSNYLVYLGDERFCLEDGQTGYGDEVFSMKSGLITIHIPEAIITQLLAAAIDKGEAKVDFVTDVEDRLGSPGSPNFQGWEDNVKQYHGQVILSLKIENGEARFSYQLPEHELHDWSGY